MDEARLLKEQDTELEKDLERVKFDYGISAAQIDAFTNIFEAIDLEKDRELSPLEIEGAMDMLDLGITVEDMKVLYRKVDSTMSGIDLANFIRLILSTPKFANGSSKNLTSSLLRRGNSHMDSSHSMTFWHSMKKMMGFKLSQHDREDEAARTLQRLWRRHRAQVVAKQELATRRMRRTGKGVIDI